MSDQNGDKEQCDEWKRDDDGQEGNKEVNNGKVKPKIGWRVMKKPMNKFEVFSFNFKLKITAEKKQ